MGQWESLRLAQNTVDKVMGWIPFVVLGAARRWADINFNLNGVAGPAEVSRQRSILDRAGGQAKMAW
jgi:hypothetical protein